MTIVANAFGERAVLELSYAALMRASEGWRGIETKPFEVKQIEAMKEELDAEHRRRHEPLETLSDGASPPRSSSKNRT